MNRIKGDLIQLALEGEFDLIIHGCNCFCTMGAGIAAQIRTHFPQALEADQATGEGDTSKLGRYSMARATTGHGELIIINGYTQFHYAGQGVLADYNAIAALFARLKKDFSGQRMGYPKIGAGLAGGDFNRIAHIIDQALEGENHTLVEYLGLQKESFSTKRKGVFPSSMNLLK